MTVGDASGDRRYRANLRDLRQRQVHARQFQVDQMRQGHIRAEPDERVPGQKLVCVHCRGARRGHHEQRTGPCAAGCAVRGKGRSPDNGPEQQRQGAGAHRPKRKVPITLRPEIASMAFSSDDPLPDLLRRFGQVIDCGDVLGCWRQLHWILDRLPDSRSLAGECLGFLFCLCWCCLACVSRNRRQGGKRLRGGICLDHRWRQRVCKGGAPRLLCRQELDRPHERAGSATADRRVRVRVAGQAPWPSSRGQGLIRLEVSNRPLRRAKSSCAKAALRHVPDIALGNVPLLGPLAHGGGEASLLWCNCISPGQVAARASPPVSARAQAVGRLLSRSWLFLGLAVSVVRLLRRKQGRR